MGGNEELSRWVAAGLISGEQAAQIRAFEGARHASRPTLAHAIAGVGALAMAVGVVSIVAANWDAIGGRVKIGIDLLLVAVLGAAVWWWDRTDRHTAREIGIVVLYGLVLASIALLGQVYQLGGEIHEALAAWTVLTALLMSRARSGAAARVWVAGLQVTGLVLVIHVADVAREEVAVAALYLVPLACLAIGRAAPVRRARPALAAALETVGWGELVLLATLGTFAFYEDTAGQPWGAALPVIAGSALATLAIAAGLVTDRGSRVLLVACLLVSHGPVLVSTGGLDVLAALSFVALWLVVAWSAHEARDASMLNLATAMIGVRIVAVYFEVFGSLLDTGLGLVGGGLLVLGLSWVWARKRRDFQRELTGKDEVSR